MDIRLLLVPYDSGQRNVRMGAGPDHLRNEGLAEHLAAAGHNVDWQVIESASTHWRAEVQTSFELMRAIAGQVRAARELPEANTRPEARLGGPEPGWPGIGWPGIGWPIGWPAYG